MYNVAKVTVQELPDPLPEGLSVLDVRDHAEWEHGHIDGAVHIPMGELTQRLDELPVGHTVVVCRVGARSAQVVAYLSQQGHDVVNLDGGMVEWADAGRGMVSETGRAPHVV